MKNNSIKIQNLLYAVQKSLTANNFYHGNLHYNAATKTISSDNLKHDADIFDAVQLFLNKIESIENTIYADNPVR